MLQLSGSLVNRPVLSLRTGGKVAVTGQPIINPNNLKIEGFYCEDLVNRGTIILLEQDIREIITQGLVINDYDVLSHADELIRLRDLIALHFDVMGKQVVSDTKRSLGKVNDYSADSQTLFIQKLYVVQSMFKSFSSTQLGIDRNQIIEITNKHIIVQEPLQPHRSTIAASPNAA